MRIDRAAISVFSTSEPKVKPSAPKRLIRRGRGFFTKEGENIDRYYQKAITKMQVGAIEEAITDFIAGVERGGALCAYGLWRTVIEYGSYTITEEEAEAILSSVYPDIRRLAEEGDFEAVRIVAEAIRYGLVEEDEPYLFWLHRAAAMGDGKAEEMLKKEEEEPPQQGDAVTMESLLSDITAEIADEEILLAGLSEECVLIADGDLFSPEMISARRAYEEARTEGKEEGSTDLPSPAPPRARRGERCVRYKVSRAPLDTD